MEKEGNLHSDLISLSELAIHNYNQQHHKGKDEFKLVVPLSYTKLCVDEPCDPFLHLSFIAKNQSTSKLKMFFAEISYDKEVLTCTIVEPGNPLFQSGCMACLPADIICHPLVYKGVASDRQGGYRRLRPYDLSVQQLLSEKYTIRPKVRKLNTEDVDKLKEAVVGYAHKAVKEYNSNNGASYEYLEPVFCVRFRYNGYSRVGIFWAHLFFKARNKGTNSKDPVLLFAELGLDSDYVSCVTMRNTPSGSLPKITCSIPQSKSGRHKHCPIRHSENDFTETGAVFADCEFGAFADCWCEGQCWGVRSELHEETGVASENAWLEFIKQEKLPGIFS